MGVVSSIACVNVTKVRIERLFVFKLCICKRLNNINNMSIFRFLYKCVCVCACVCVCVCVCV